MGPGQTNEPNIPPTSGSGESPAAEPVSSGPQTEQTDPFPDLGDFLRATLRSAHAVKRVAGTVARGAQGGLALGKQIKTAAEDAIHTTLQDVMHISRLVRHNEAIRSALSQPEVKHAIICALETFFESSRSDWEKFQPQEFGKAQQAMLSFAEEFRALSNFFNLQVSEFKEHAPKFLPKLMDSLAKYFPEDQLDEAIDKFGLPESIFRELWKGKARGGK